GCRPGRRPGPPRPDRRRRGGHGRRGAGARGPGGGGVREVLRRADRRPRRQGHRAAGGRLTAMHGEMVVVDDVPGEFAERVIEAFHRRPNDGFSLAVSGGQLARRCYERLADDAGSQIDWWKVDLYWGDERCVPHDHPDSNYRLVREALLSRVGAVNANYPMFCEQGPDPYQLLLGELGKLDVIHLGLGADGHTASIFPDSPGFAADPGRLVVMNE